MASGISVEGGHAKIPVTILTGFLGAGKTTFVNYLLKENHGHKLAIIENEFGEVGIDGGLVVQSEDQVVEMMNGCLCCTVRDDLIGAMESLYERRAKFDGVMIETTGMADPGPIAQTFFMDENIKDKFYIDSVTTFVDCKHVIMHLEEEKEDGVKNESVDQIGFADVIVLNKTDLVTPEELANVRSRVKSINATAKLLTSVQSRVDIKEVLDVKAFDLDKTLEMDENFLKGDGHSHEPHNDHSDHEGEHKGEHGHGHGHGHKHHDSSISSVGFCMEGSFLGDKFDDWMNDLLREKGADLYRSKGIISMVDSDERFVFQGVHMLVNFGSLEGKPWGEDEKRINKFCFIGKNLDRKELQEGLRSCLWDGKLPEPGPKPTVLLRFNVGDKVLVHSDEWCKGVILETWYRDPYWESGHYVPYQIDIRDEEDNGMGMAMWVPRDTDQFVRERHVAKANKKRKLDGAPMANGAHASTMPATPAPSGKKSDSTDLQGLLIQGANIVQAHIQWQLALEQEARKIPGVTLQGMHTALAGQAAVIGLALPPLMQVPAMASMNPSAAALLPGQGNNA